VRKLILSPDGKTVSHAIAVSSDRPDQPVELRAKVFVVAAGYTWSSHLLLLSAQENAPNGVANSSGLVGKYLAGHRNVQTTVELPLRLYPGMNEQHSLVTKQFMRLKAGSEYVRHDLRIWESSNGRAPRLVDDKGALMLGDAILDDWRTRTKTGTARVRAYYDVIPDRASELTLDPTRKNAYGDPLPKLAFRDAPESVSMRRTPKTRFVPSSPTWPRRNGRLLRTPTVDNFQDHPSGGCRMGSDASSSVVDSWGRAHDHENLFVVGAPTCVSGSCANATLTFCALALRSAREMEKGCRRPRRPVQRPSMIRRAVVALVVATSPIYAQSGEWPVYGADLGATKYSPLADINRGNVRALTKAWEWATGETPNADLRTRPGNFQATPLMIGDTLYLSTSYNRVVALDANSGHPYWAYDPKAYAAGQPPNGTGFVHRGVATWTMARVVGSS
jgi:quinoprotein glucose dehydrogenase